MKVQFAIILLVGACIAQHPPIRQLQYPLEEQFKRDDPAGYRKFIEDIKGTQAQRPFESGVDKNIQDDSKQIPPQLVPLLVEDGVIGVPIEIRNKLRNAPPRQLYFEKNQNGANYVNIVKTTKKKESNGFLRFVADVLKTHLRARGIYKYQ